MKAITLQDYKQRLLRVLVHIQQDLDGTLRLDELARLAHFSPYHFHRVFRGMLGESLQGHIRRLRLERAATQLKGGARPITRIALDSGFETPEAFTRAFHARFGLSPSRYRVRQRRPPPPRDPASRSGVHFAGPGGPGTSAPPRRARASAR